MTIYEAVRLPTDAPTWKRFLGEVPGKPFEVVSVIFEERNREVTAHVSVSVWSVAGNPGWLRAPTDDELNQVSQHFGQWEWEEDNTGRAGAARHLWAKE